MLTTEPQEGRGAVVVMHHLEELARLVKARMGLVVLIKTHFSQAAVVAAAQVHQRDR